jgi:hypothetical protein
MNEAQITELISEPDVVEIVRDQVAAILSTELKNQFAIAQNEGASDAKDYNIPLYVENGRPYEAQCDSPIMRFINVLLPRVSLSEGSGNNRFSNSLTGSHQKEQVTFFIDCAACGNDSGNFRDDKSSAFRAWKIMRLVRRILMSNFYAYLGLRGTVGARIISIMEAGTPEEPKLDRESALSFVVVRATLEVQFLERNIEAEGPPLEIIDFEVDPVSGELTSTGG